MKTYHVVLTAMGYIMCDQMVEAENEKDALEVAMEDLGDLGWTVEFIKEQGIAHAEEA